MMLQTRTTTFLFGENQPYIKDLYQTYLADAAQRQRWQLRLESARARAALTPAQRRRVPQRLTAAEGLEKFLHTRYTGPKRFSLEGGESLIVLLDELIRHGASHGVRRAVLGMAHRGRLNVLVNTLGKPPRALFDEFEGKTARLLPAGDVRYHKGYSGIAVTDDGEVEVALAFNASHLEIVNPVVQGIARAQAERFGDGGTVHIVVNNQIGFTTSDPGETRSTFYCTDIAKLIEAPVLHVNADDPEAVVAAVRLALDYRAIAGHPGVRALYAQRLVAEGLLTAQQVAQEEEAYRAFMAGQAEADAPDAAAHDAGREASASTAPGYASLHLEQQARVVDHAFGA